MVKLYAIVLANWLVACETAGVTNEGKLPLGVSYETAGANYDSGIPKFYKDYFRKIWTLKYEHLLFSRC